jgi:hypothetical protein
MQLKCLQDNETRKFETAEEALLYPYGCSSSSSSPLAMINRESPQQKTITIGFLSPYNQNQFSLGAMRLAVETINKNASILPGVTLQFTAADIGR